MAIKNIELTIGRAVSFENENLLISHYSADGDIITLYTDKGEKSYFRKLSRIN